MIALNSSIAQGLGGNEHLIYDDAGATVHRQLMDYLMPTHR